MQMDVIQHIPMTPSLLNHIFDEMSDAVAIIHKKDGNLKYTYANPVMKRVYGGLEGQNLLDVHGNELCYDFAQTVDQADHRPGVFIHLARSGSHPYLTDYRLQSLVETEMYLLFIKVNTSVVLEWLGKAKESRYESLVETSPDSIFVHDHNDRIVYVNQAALKMLGGKRETDLVGKDVKNFLHDEAEADVRDRLKLLFDGRFVEGPIERQLKTLDGRIVDVELHGGLIEYQGIKAVQTIGRNISERRKQQKKLEKMAYFDQLTKVPNRRYFFEKLNEELKRIEGKDTRMALLFIDLDNFKQINDQFGHQIGDEVLVIFTKRLGQCLRKTDTLSRLGGDEFVILLTDIMAPDHPRNVADRMLEKVLQPVSLEGHEINISVSIGISVYPEHGTSQGDLLTKADRALYKAKESGRSRVSVYSLE